MFDQQLNRLWRSHWRLAGKGSDERVNGSAVIRFFLASQKSCFLKAEVSRAIIDRLADDDMIEEINLENSCTGCDSPGDSQIRFGRVHGTRWVIVHQYETVRRVRNYRPENVSWIRKRCVHRSLSDFYLRDASELAIKQNNAHHLLRKAFHVEVGFIDRFGVAERSR
jgi:hypothetical protein